MLSSALHPFLCAVRGDTRLVLMSAVASLPSSVSTAQVPIQNDTDSFLDRTGHLSPDSSQVQSSSQASAVAREAARSTTLETAFSKGVLLLPQLWGKGASPLGAIQHNEPLGTSFFVENPRGDAYRHLEVLVNHPNSAAPEHSPPPPHSLPPPPPAQSAEPPPTSSPGVAHESAGSGVVRQVECADSILELSLDLTP